MSLIIDPNNPVIETVNDKIKRTGTYVFETNMPGSASWATGLTVNVDLQSPFPGDEDEWETLHTFSDKGSWRVDMITDRIYRVISSEVGPWVFLNLVRDRVTR